MPVLTAADLRHGFGDRTVLDGVSLSIQRGERIGLVGDNGAGKSTLASILAGKIVPDRGEVSRRKGLEFAYLAQEVEFEGVRTARDAIMGGLVEWSAAMQEYERITQVLSAESNPAAKLIEDQSAVSDTIERLGGWDQAHRAQEIATHLGVRDLDQSVDSMSGGERKRVALARVLVSEPGFAVLDEPTNHLDVATIEWLENHLVQEYSGALLLITHDRYMLDGVAQRTWEIDHGALYSYPGGWGPYLEAKAERIAHEQRAESNRQNTLRRELEWLRRSPKARSTKQQARVDRAVALRDAAAPPARDVKSQFAFRSERIGKTVIELDGLSLSIGGRELIRDLSLVLKGGDRLGIIGPNGAGKTTLMRALLGELQPTGGRLNIGSTVQFAYFDQERTELDDEATILENVTANQENVSIAGQSLNSKSYLARFHFVGDRQRQKVATLSGGERARVAMAKFLLQPANVLLLDEPTNDLDVTTLSALEELLVEGNTTLLFVSHDRYFLDRVATGVLAFEDSGAVVHYADYAQALRAGASPEKPKDAPAPERLKTPAKSARSAGGLTFSEKHELDGIMPAIEAAEREVAELDKALSDPTLYTARGAEVPALQASHAAAKARLEEALARWEHLEGKRTGGN